MCIISSFCNLLIIVGLLWTSFVRPENAALGLQCLTDRGKFPREAMLAAVEQVENGSSICKAAADHGLSYKSLSRYATVFVTSYPKLVTFYPRPGLKVTSQTVMFKVKKQNKNTTEFTFPSIGNLDDIVV